VSALITALVLTAAPVIGPAPKWSPPAVQVRTLSSGAKLWVVPQHAVPLVHVGVVVNAGSLFDLPGREGLASIVVTGVEECGAGERTGAQVRAEFDALGTALESMAMTEGAALAFSVTTPQLQTALALTGDLLTKPRFEPKALEGVQARLRSELVTMMDSPQALASMHLAEELYGTAPRGHLAVGTTLGLAAVTLDEVKNFHAEHWGSASTTFVLVGDIEPDAAKALLDKLLPRPWGKPAATPPPSPAASAHWVAFDKPGAPQTVVALAQGAVNAGDPEAVPLELVATVLGGSFTSRLVQNLREKHGYTYGVGATLAAGRERALKVSTAVKTEVTAPAMTELVNELNGAGTVSDDELAKARALGDADLVDGFASGERLLWTLSTLIMNGEAPDTLGKEQAQRAATTLEQAKKSAARFASSNFTVVLVGDKAKIEKDVAKAFPSQKLEWKK